MEERENIKNLIITISIIIITLLVFYLLTIIITNKKNEKNNNQNNQTTVIDYENILVSDIYKQKETTYYVFAFLKDDKKLNNYQSSLTNYIKKENALPVYKIDLNSALNKKYISEKTDLTGQFPIFSETTLLKIENSSIVESYQNKDISTVLSTLTK